VPHRPGQVQVQVRLGELVERTGHPPSVPAPAACPCG
jgi:hypothetical protein